MGKVIRVPFHNEAASLAPARAPSPPAPAAPGTPDGSGAPAWLAGAAGAQRWAASPEACELSDADDGELFDVDVEDAGAAAAASAAGVAPPQFSDDGAPVEAVAAQLAALLAPASGAEAALAAHVALAADGAARRGRRLEAPALAATLARCGYAVSPRATRGGGAGGACLRNLRHSFLTAAAPSAAGAGPMLVDPHFREQFEVAHPTPRYAAVLAACPAAAVAGHPGRLEPAVRLLCAEMARAFAETGRALPPWRTRGAMLSKWLGRA